MVAQITKHFKKRKKAYLFGILLFSVLATNFYIENLKNGFFTDVCRVLDHPKRESIIWSFCILVCGFYFYYERHLKSENRKGVLKLSNVFLDFVSSFYTFSAVLNSCLNLLSGILKEFTNSEKFFVHGTLYDFYFVIACSILPIIWVVTQMYEYIICIFKIDIEEFTPKSIPSDSNPSEPN